MTTSFIATALKPLTRINSAVAVRIDSLVVLANRRLLQTD